MKFKGTEEHESQSILSKNEFLDLKILRRASKMTQNMEQEKIRQIQFPYLKKSTIKKFPRKTKSILPSINLKSLKQSQKINVFITFIISVITVSVSIYECDALHNSNYSLNFSDNILRMSLIVLNVIQVFLIVSYHKKTFELKISHKIISKHSSLTQDKDELKKILAEAFLCFILLPPYITYKKSFTQLGVVQILSIEDILLIFILIRVFHLYKLYYEFSSFNSLRPRFYCNIFRIDDQFTFILRCFFKDLPYTSVIFTFTLSITLFGYLLHIYEQSVESSAFVELWNGFWIISYTESTVGYGDIVPKTHLGRFLCIISSFFGVFMYSYTVSVFRNTAQLNPSQAKLYLVLRHKDGVEKKLKVSSAILIQRWWRLNMKRRIKISTIKDIHKFNTQLINFSYLRNKMDQQMNPTLSESVEKLSGLPIIRIRALTKSLKPILKSEQQALRLANMYYASSKKINYLNRRIKKLFGIKNYHQMGILAHPKSAVPRLSLENRALLKKKQDIAVKKMINKRMNRISLSKINHSLSSDEDFYSSYGGSHISEFD